MHGEPGASVPWQAEEIETSSELSGGWTEWAGLREVNLSLGRFAGRVPRAS